MIIYKKALAIIRWMLVGFLSLYFWLTAKLFAPLIFPLRHLVFRYKIPYLYYYIDKQDGFYGSEYFNKKMQRQWKWLYKLIVNKPYGTIVEETNMFWKFILFCGWNGFRNTAWNAMLKLAPRNINHSQVYHSWIGHKYKWKPSMLSVGFIKYVESYDVSVFDPCKAVHVDSRAKYDPHGEFISNTNSMWGWEFFWFWNVDDSRPEDKVKKTLHFRFTLFNGKFEIQLGTSDDLHSPSRFIYKLKYKGKYKYL